MSTTCISESNSTTPTGTYPTGTCPYKGCHRGCTSKNQHKFFYAKIRCYYSQDSSNRTELVNRERSNRIDWNVYNKIIGN